MNPLRLFIVYGVCAFSSWAWAQSPERGVAAEDRRAESFNEIEHGLYFGVQGGPLFWVNPPASQGPRPFSPGQMAQVEIGADLGGRLSLGAFVMGSANRAGSDYLGNSGGSVSGDFSALVPGAVARVHLAGFANDQGLRRAWVYARAGAGWALFWPRQLLPESDILVFGGPGVEYYTRLRHFSVGLEATAAFLVSSKTFGFMVSPNLRYAF